MLSRKEMQFLGIHTLVCHTCYMIMILARIMSSHDFITFKAKVGNKELGNDVDKFPLSKLRRYVVSK
jgi:hypothetical protein